MRKPIFGVWCRAYGVKAGVVGIADFSASNL